MAKLQVISHERQAENALRSAVLAKIKRLEIGLDATNHQIESFEIKYKISSEHFLKEFSAEDLEGGDSEYVEWAGEIKIKERLLDELHQLQDIEYVSK